MSRLAPALLTILIAAAAPAALAHDRDQHHDHGYAAGSSYYTGRIEVYNGSGGRITLSVAGQPSQVVEAYRTAVLYAPAGETTLRATYRQFGADRVLQADRLTIYAGRTVRVALAPERLARVRITNASPFSATLLVNGVSKGLLAPGEVRVAALPVGSAELQLLAAGRVLGQTRLELRPFAEPSWRVDVPAVGDLVVQNPLPIPVQLVTGSGAPITVAPYGQATLTRLPAGVLQVSARRVSGQPIDNERVEIRTFGVTTWRVDPPRTGLVTIDSDLPVGAELRLDGRLMASLVPDGMHTLETTLGWHQLEARDPYGRVVYADWVEVEPFDVARVEFGERVHQRADDRAHADRDDREDWQRRDDGRDAHAGHDHDGDAVAEGDEHCHMR